MIRMLRTVCMAAAFSIAGAAIAAPKTLITYEGDKAGPAIAKSWKKGKGSTYDFTLDSSVDVGQGKKSIADVVKKSLESKLGPSNGVSVKAKGKDAVTVTYTGDEKEFLGALSKTRIRADDDTQIAMEGTVSQGGVRAKTAERDPADGEVKGTVVSVKGDVIAVRITNVSPQVAAKGVKAGDKVSVKAPGYAAKKEDKIFFVPEAKEGETWKASGFKAN